MTAVISSSVAEKALCWCEGRSRRNRRANPRAGSASGESAEFAIKGRFYTQTLASPDTPDGSLRLKLFGWGNSGMGQLGQHCLEGMTASTKLPRAAMISLLHKASDNLHARGIQPSWLR